MRFDDLLSVLHEQVFFDYTTVTLFFDGESPATIRTSLHRFVKEGKLTALRRGLYAFGPRYRKTALTGPRVANLLYQPSYLSERWALGWYGIIPEKVVTFTSVTPRSTRRFTNDWGSFLYRTISRSSGSGTVSVPVAGEEIVIAEGEQALLDLWYLEGGEWTPQRMESMRFNPEPVDTGRLSRLAGSFHSHTVDAAVRSWIAYAGAYDEGVPIA